MRLVYMGVPYVAAAMVALLCGVLVAEAALVGVLLWRSWE